MKPLRQLKDLKRQLSNPEPIGPPHERVGWKAEEYFDDPQVIALCKAIEAKDLPEIDRLVKSGVNVNAKGRGNMTPLLWSFPMGEEVFGRLLEHGADPNVQFTEELGLLVLVVGDSVVTAAAWAGGPLVHYFHDVSMDNYLKLVLAHGGDPNLENSSGYTPLFRAVIGVGNSAERIRQLLDAGANINHQNRSGATPAMVATGLRYDSLLILLKAGADWRIVSKGGPDLVTIIAETPVIPGAYQTQELIAVRQWLEQQGADLKAAKLAAETNTGLHLPADQRPWLNPKAKQPPPAKPK